MIISWFRLFFTLFTDEIIDRIHESGFRIAAQKETNLTRELAEEFYAEHKGKEYYDDLVEHMTRLVNDQVKTTCLNLFFFFTVIPGMNM